jgi:acetyl esterase/lipase
MGSGRSNCWGWAIGALAALTAAVFVPAHRVGAGGYILPESAMSKSKPPEPPGSVTFTQDLSYGPLAKQRLDFCRPAAGAAPLPVLLLFHGGGLSGGDKAQHTFECLFFAQFGILVANVNFRLVVAGDPTTRWPAFVEDAQLAVRWLRANAAEHGIDPARMCSTGYSSGGHVAAMTAFMSEIFPGDMAHLFSRQSPQVGCFVDHFGPMDFLQVPGWQVTETKLFGDTMPRPKRCPASPPNFACIISPLYYIEQGAAQTLTIQGDRDGFVPPINGAEVNARLTELGIRNVSITYRGKHNWIGQTDAQVDMIELRAAEFLQHFLHP